MYKFVFMAMLILGNLAVAKERSPSSEAVICNSEVKWMGTFVGLQYKAEGTTRLFRLRPDLVSDRQLLDALSDKNKYVAAHVLLTHRHIRTVNVNASDWHGLRVELYGNGDIDYDERNQARLLNYWTRYFRSLRLHPYRE